MEIVHVFQKKQKKYKVSGGYLTAERENTPIGSKFESYLSEFLFLRQHSSRVKYLKSCEIGGQKKQ